MKNINADIGLIGLGVMGSSPVSSTHLTLPTAPHVWISVVSVGAETDQRSSGAGEKSEEATATGA